MVLIMGWSDGGVRLETAKQIADQLRRSQIRNLFCHSYWGPFKD
jgi:hypothetical protein